jgi:nucleoside 2-deoxyribosyltransferase
MISIYLAGHVGETEYRRYVNEKYCNMFKINDPLQLIEIRPNITRDEIVREDKSLIFESYILVAYIQKPTFGTIMEVIYAFEHDIPVYVINPGYTFKNDIWLSYHTKKFFNDIDSCFSFINENYNKYEESKIKYAVR